MSVGLRYWQDWQSIVYIVALPLLVGYQWHHPFSWPLYATQLFLTLGVGVIHHNHTHLPIWRHKMLNRTTDLWLTLLQGHPTLVFYPTHLGNHHKYKHSEKDLARTYAFNGDTNTFIGYLLHPFYALCRLYPVYLIWLCNLRRKHSKLFWFCLSQYLLVMTSWIFLICLNPKQWVIYIFIPQMHGLHWLLATNYLQHAHADSDTHNKNYARNFEGWVNPLLFNIGLHTAHHEHSKAHWSSLPALHARYKHQIDPVLNQKGLLCYMIKTFIVSIFCKKYQSRSLRDKGTGHHANRI